MWGERREKVALTVEKEEMKKQDGERQKPSKESIGLGWQKTDHMRKMIVWVTGRNATSKKQEKKSRRGKNDRTGKGG